MMGPELSLSWTVAGDLRLDDITEDQPKLHVNFYDWRRLTRTEKLRLLRIMVETALETPELVVDLAAAAAAGERFQG